VSGAGRTTVACLDLAGTTVADGGAVETAFSELAEAGIHICLITGFSRRTLGRVLDALGWWDRVDFALCPEDGGRGRPWPDLVLSAALRVGVDDVRHIAVCGDTENDMLSGRRAGASVVAGVLTGAHDRDRLLRAGATHVLTSVADFPDLVLPRPDPAPVTDTVGDDAVSARRG
jgi:phosphonatase-like hydrolase